MAVAAALVVVPLGLLFLLSGLIVNLIQATLFITIRPFSKSLYRRINRAVAELLWLQLVWLVDWWAGVKAQKQMEQGNQKGNTKAKFQHISNVEGPWKIE